MTAGGGNDTISARDSTRDTIDCGGGVDKVTADRTDVVKNLRIRQAGQAARLILIPLGPWP